MLDNDLLHLTHEQQQLAVEKIQELMAQGVGSGEAIALVAKKLRENRADKAKEK
ncbi:YoaH family protein [Aggregatibacter actinomycetemcomitans]|uniref:YoaH family protein n=1 Tax=Aggregatibacter actinomycetemcomitans TaxID=714 RepID=UPI00022ADBA4|nr:YoaH family protein [Aggregatibacter actinomycetemcomitans]KND82640.1 aspartate-semialdehyde dehydrogenase [Aggregatibacter actinomycetemcomitans serotype b str. SCC1398]KOE51606.1 aspartate-semialdehyde dehydrogenase [Aggregatibacter actinomycetemcomitans serotype b str. SCC4092]